MARARILIYRESMKRLILALLLCSATATAQDGTVPSFMTGAELVNFCTIASDAHGSYCNGYLSGLLDAEALHPAHAPLCVPRPIDVREVRVVFIAWSQQNAHELHRAASSLLREAATKAWPCERRPA